MWVENTLRTGLVHGKETVGYLRRGLWRSVVSTMLPLVLSGLLIGTLFVSGNTGAHLELSGLMFPTAYRPVGGNPRAGVVSYESDYAGQVSTNALLRDFRVKALFENPARPDVAWNYGFHFRSTARSSYYLLVQSDATWRLIHSVWVGPRPTDRQVGAGTLTRLITTSGASNKVALVADHSVGVLSVNENESVRLDLSADQEAGELLAISGYQLQFRGAQSLTAFDSFAAEVPTATQIQLPLFSSFGQSGSTRVVTVSAKSDWVDPGIDVRAGELLRISAAPGFLWRECERCTPTGPSGSNKPEYDPDSYRDNVMWGCRHAALIAELAGTMICAEDELRIRAQESGALRLRINDRIIDDNDGAIAVQVSIQ